MKIKQILNPLILLLGISSSQTVARVRKRLASQYLHGIGIEIGALHRPLDVKFIQNIKVSYVDRLNTGQLRLEYPELKQLDLVDVDLVDCGETLNKVQQDSLDFIVANHFIEHCENPIGTIRTHVSKLKQQGILFYAVPNRNKTFDRDRPVTSFNHLLKDDREGTDWSRFAHYVEWVKKVMKVDSLNQEKINDLAKKMIDSKESIHFHVWDARSLKDFAKEIEFLMKIKLCEFVKVRDEIILIFSKNY